MVKLLIAVVLVLILASLVLTIGRWLLIGAVVVMVLVYASVISASDIPAAPAWSTVTAASAKIATAAGAWIDRLSTRLDAMARRVVRTPVR